MVQWTMELNNLLQCNGKAGQVTYESNHEGPDNQGFWRVTALCKSTSLQMIDSELNGMTRQRPGDGRWNR